MRYQSGLGPKIASATALLTPDRVRICPEYVFGRSEVFSDGIILIVAKRRRQFRLATIVRFLTKRGGQSALKRGQADFARSC